MTGRYLVKLWDQRSVNGFRLPAVNTLVAVLKGRPDSLSKFRRPGKFPFYPLVKYFVVKMGLGSIFSTLGSNLISLILCPPHLFLHTMRSVEEGERKP